MRIPRLDKGLDLIPRGEIVASPIRGSQYAVSAYPGDERAIGDSVFGWEAVRRLKWILILSPVLGIIIGLFVAALQAPVYKARASLEVQGINGNFLNMNDALPVSEQAISNGLNDVQTQMMLLQSDSVLNPVLARIGDGHGSLSRSTRPVVFWPRWLPSVRPSARDARREAKRLADTLKVRTMGSTRMVEMTAESSDPELAAEFLNQICAEFIQRNIQARLELSQRTSEWLTGMLEEMRAKLERSEASLQSYARESGLLMTSDNKNVAEEELHQLQDELSKAEADRIAQQSWYETIKSATADLAPDKVTESRLRDYEAKIADLKRTRADLATIYTPNHSKVKRIDAQIASLQESFELEKRRILSQITTSYQQAVRREAMLSTRFAAQSQLVSDLERRTIHYTMLQHELDSNRQLYDLMLQRAKEASLASAMQTTNIRIVDPAVPPSHPFSPKPILNCSVGFFVGSCFGMLLALVRHSSSDTRVREPGDVRDLRLVELGTILHDSTGVLLRSPDRRHFVKLPLRKGKDRRHQELRSRLDSLERVWLAVRGFGPSGNANSSLVLESGRGLATSLLLSCRMNGVNRGVFAITSAGPSEGKTTVTCNLALTLAAHARKRILIVDADIRGQGISELFGLPNEKGLSSLLAEGCITRERLEMVVQTTCIPDICVMTSGPSLAANLHYLHGPELSQLVVLLKREYDVVLIDTAPILCAADSRLVARAADGVFLVVRAGQTSKDAAGAAHERLLADGTRVLGMILNDCSLKAGSREYYSDYARGNRAAFK